MHYLVGVICLASLGATHGASAEPAYKAGVAVKVITPREFLWMAGYAARTRPAEAKLQDLYAKALALEDSAGHRMVLVTSDLLGFPRSVSAAVAMEVERRTGLRRDQLMLTASHTHSGPVIGDSLGSAYGMSPEEWTKVQAYTDRLKGLLSDVVAEAVADLKPARLAMGTGKARFALNRRESKPDGHGGYIARGPVDHDVPVLIVETPGAKLRALVFGYACHNTTLQGYDWCGDYAGFAQAYLEQKHPGAKALFWSGCGADANPLPRGTVPLCQKYGRELANSVDDVLAGGTRPVEGPFTSRYADIELPLDKLPAKEQLTAQLLDKNVSVQRRATRLLKELEQHGKLDDRYRHYPVQVWRLGKSLVWISLGGEVVVDYDLRLKKELAGATPVWITAYANDVMAYIPSVRVLKEGGYEGDTSMIYYGLPTKWAPPIEERIIGKVHELVKEAE
jgi:hypothetical protein